jgi:hypothetical protein
MMEITHEPRLGALFDNRAGAEAAVEDLRRSGLADEHLGVAVHSSDDYVFEESLEDDMARALKKGIAIGAPIGAIAGITVLSLIVPTVGVVLGVGGILAAGGITGALAGGFWGAYLGLKGSEAEMDEEWDWERLGLEPGQVMVVVDQHGEPDEAKAILSRHGGRLVGKPPHLG